MRFHPISYLFIALFFVACQGTEPSSVVEVSSQEGLDQAIADAKAGDEIVIKNGTYRDFSIVLDANGSAEHPIILRAESPGEVYLEGQSYLKIGGSYMDVSGLYFRNGYTPSNAVIDFKITKKNVANYVTVHDIVIEDYNQTRRNRKDHWVEFWGKHNALKNSYLAGKTNEGPTLRVEIKGNRNIENYHEISGNHFGPRPRKGGPKAETIQLGDSFSSMSPSNTLISGNLFEYCNGEVEVISSKTNFNRFEGNVFLESEGSLVTRHGNYASIKGNLFYGDGINPYVGGIRLINTGHVVTNNYFEGLRGSEFRSPIAIMNGIPKSPLNRYNQVTDVTVSSNSFVNCADPFQIGVGQNLDQKDVLPPSEIRSAIPIRTDISNNYIEQDIPDMTHIIDYDDSSEILFKFNYVQIPDEEIDARFKRFKEGAKAYIGYDYEKFNAVQVGAQVDKTPRVYGPSWFKVNTEKSYEAVTISSVSELQAAMSSDKDSLQINLNKGTYDLSEGFKVDKIIVLKAEKGTTFNFDSKQVLFEMQSYGSLHIDGIEFKGKGTAFASAKQGMHNHYNVAVVNSSFSGFDQMFHAYKHSFAQSVSFTNSSFKNIKNGFSFAAEVEAKGDYNVSELSFVDCSFEHISTPVIDYYRGGYDESTIGGIMVIEGSVFENCSGSSPLIDHTGIINVSIDDSEFMNNKVPYISRIWTSKNNDEKGNHIVNSSNFIRQSQIKSKLVY